MLYVVGGACGEVSVEMSRRGLDEYGDGEDGWVCVHQRGFPHLEPDDRILFLPGAEARPDYETLYEEATFFWRLDEARRTRDLQRIVAELEAHG